MQANSWWLLAVPVLFGLGWIGAKIDSAQLLKRTRQLPESYFQGLNFLLNDHYDQAIQSFEEVARLDPDIAELYFTLGNLFRRRGETDRAIRIHRNLLERADLPEKSREYALFCLGKDYLNAGIFDRAESVFRTLIESNYALQSQKELAKLYEKESNWQAAIDCLQHYQHISQSHHQSLKDKTMPIDDNWLNQDLAHYFCELADIYLQESNFIQAKANLDLAQTKDLNNPRIIFYSIRLLLLSNGRYSLNINNAVQDNTVQDNTGYSVIYNAVQPLDHVLNKTPQLTALALHTVLTYSPNNQVFTPTILEYFKRWVNRYPTFEVMMQLLPIFKYNQDEQSELELLHSLAIRLKQFPPNLSAIHVLLSNSLDSRYSNYAEQWQADALDAIKKMIKHTDKLICNYCGFKASQHQWRCIGCGHWNTLPYSKD